MKLKVQRESAPEMQVSVSEEVGLGRERGHELLTLLSVAQRPGADIGAGILAEDVATVRLGAQPRHRARGPRR